MWIGYNCELSEVDVRKIVEKMELGSMPKLNINNKCREWDACSSRSRNEHVISWLMIFMYV